MFDVPSVSIIAGMVQGLFFWVFVLALVLGLAIGPRYIRSRERQRLYDLMKTAYEKGQPVPPELIASLTKGDIEPAPISTSGPSNDLRRAIVLIAVGLGLVGLGAGLGFGLSFASDTAGAIVGGIVAGCGAIPGFIGLAYLILWLATGRGRATPGA